MAKMKKRVLDPVAAAIKSAADGLEKDREDGRSSMEQPTPERAARANGSRVVLLGVYRVEDSEIAKLAARGCLDPRDSGHNAALLLVAENYFDHAYKAGLLPSGSPDPSRIKVDCTGSSAAPWKMAISEVAWDHRKKYRRAEEAMGQRYSSVVNAIVLHDETLLAVGLRVSGYTHHHAARAVALDRLREGLERLLAGEASKGGKDDQIRSWRDEGSRPTDNWGKDS